MPARQWSQLMSVSLSYASFSGTTWQKGPFNTDDKAEKEEKEGGETKNDRTRLQVTEKA